MLQLCWCQKSIYVDPVWTGPWHWPTRLSFLRRCRNLTGRAFKNLALSSLAKCPAVKDMQIAIVRKSCKALLLRPIPSTDPTRVTHGNPTSERSERNREWQPWTDKPYTAPLGVASNEAWSYTSDYSDWLRLFRGSGQRNEQRHALDNTHQISSGSTKWQRSRLDLLHQVAFQSLAMASARMQDQWWIPVTAQEIIHRTHKIASPCKECILTSSSQPSVQGTQQASRSAWGGRYEYANGGTSLGSPS